MNLDWIDDAICKPWVEERGINPWTSDNPEDQEWACDACLDCPVFFQCEGYAKYQLDQNDQWRKPAGVYAGKVYWKSREDSLDAPRVSPGPRKGSKQVTIDQAREFLHLVENEGMSFSSIGRRYGVHHVTVRNQVNKARSAAS